MAAAVFTTPAEQHAAVRAQSLSRRLIAIGGAVLLSGQVFNFLEGRPLDPLGLGPHGLALALSSAGLTGILVTSRADNHSPKQQPTSALPYPTSDSKATQRTKRWT
jgi:hypothetical protein